MKIECPKCFKENSLNLEAKVNCGHCKEEITGYTYKKPLISATTALIIGAGGFFAVDNYVLSNDRYPISAEYELIELCTSSYQKPMKSRSFSEKKSVCICALEETMKDISYSDLNDEESNFIGVFETKASECR